MDESIFLAIFEYINIFSNVIILWIVIKWMNSVSFFHGNTNLSIAINNGKVAHSRYWFDNDHVPCTKY